MNFLAHIYLSFGHKEITVGNFIADSIRGKKYLKYPKGVQRGILLHRHIDTFTDAHPTFRQSTKRLHANFGHYSGVIVDIFYDHFLAKNWERYHKQPLEAFTLEFYELIEDHFDILPENVQRMMPYMMADNWLLSYAQLDGIARVLEGLNRRTQNRSKMNFAILDLEAHYPKFEAEFFSFFDELILSSKQKLSSLCET